MNLTFGLNRIAQPGEKKALSAAAVADMEDTILRGLLEQAASIADDSIGSWTELLLLEGFPPKICEQLLENGVEEKALQNDEAFAVIGAGSTLTLYANTRNGWLYAACELLHDAQTGNGHISGGLRFAAPQCPFRGLKLYLPPKDGLDEFYRIVDMLLYYRYNTVILEVGGAMEYKRHPEINESWESYCREMARYPERADEVQRMFGWEKNSIHFENGGGSWLQQETVQEIIAYCRVHGMEVIPEVPSLSHADYLLNAHQELAERSYDPFPDTYCPSNPDSYKLLFDVMDEVIDVFQPRIMQIGHDEIYSICVCEKCRKRDASELLAEDITKIHDYLAQRGIRTMYWSEKMLNHISSQGEGLAGAERWCRCSRSTVDHIPATWTAIDRIPRDCIAHNWYWALREAHDQQFLSRGMDMTYGNWDPRGIINWQKRIDAGACGAAPSHWSTAEFVTMQRNGVLMSIVYGAYLLWRTDYKDDCFNTLQQASMEELYRYHNYPTLKMPHFEFTHMTTIWREHVYITSAPMQAEKDTIGRYIVFFKSGRTLEIPLIYGVNIMNQAREWIRVNNDEWDCYDADAALSEVTATTLPLLQPDGTTQFRMVVENPWPDDPVIGVQTEKTCCDAGEIYLTSFCIRQSLADTPTVKSCSDPSHIVKTPLY